MARQQKMNTNWEIKYEQPRPFLFFSFHLRLDNGGKVKNKGILFGRIVTFPPFLSNKT